MVDEGIIPGSLVGIETGDSLIFIDPDVVLEMR